MTISLSPETQKLLEEQMQKGGYATPDDVLRIALQTLYELEAAPLEELDPQTQAAIEEGLAQANRGEGIPLDEAFKRLNQKYFGK
jgi:antitoxin ParD1/3/4